ncbi:MAG: tRNA (guanosine(18)-2'-O)-methyltransferase TrmH [Ectothiorhodospiraceae bacterium]|jgi:tRNA (guanosine-2'-O-)-methyltransferase
MSATRLERLRAALDRRQPDLRVFLEGVHKPHNLSAILRTCDAVGVFRAHAVIAEGDFTFHRNASAGVGKWVDVVTHADVATGIRAMQEEGLRVCAATLSPRAVDFREVDYTRPTAVLLGAELRGVSATAEALVDEHIVIPMDGLGQSLNVSVAAAVILFEAQRQRREAGLYNGCRLDPATYRRTLFEWMQPTVARYCRSRGLDYPELDGDGAVKGLKD